MFFRINLSTKAARSDATLARKRGSRPASPLQTPGTMSLKVIHVDLYRNRTALRRLLRFRD
jgi:hypothetical protein